jgi:hypothetical protein
VNEAPSQSYGAYAPLLERWSTEELTDAEAIVEQLVDSPAWTLLLRVLDERERKVVNQLVVTPQLEAMQMEGLRSMVNGIRQLRVIPEAIVEATRRRRETLERERQARGEPSGDA